MMQITEVLREFASEVRALAEADGAAILIHLDPLQTEGVLLECAGAPVAELADIDAARRFLARAAESSTRPIACPAAADGQLLMRLPLAEVLSPPGISEPAPPVTERRRHPLPALGVVEEGTVWIGVSGARLPDRLVALVEAISSGRSTDAMGECVVRLVALSARLAWHGYQLSQALKDPVSRLSGRLEFEGFLHSSLVAGRGRGQPVTLLLLGPDDFVMVNHRFGREAGDRVIREIAERLEQIVRQTDGVFRYGGAAFGVVLPATDMASCRRVVDKLRRQLVVRAYLNDMIELTFTIGGIVAEWGDLQAGVKPADMVRRADGALNRARLSGGSRTLLSNLSEALEEPDHFDAAGGIFTNDTEKDYRNMLLLWEAVSLVSTNPDPLEIGAQFTERLAVRFQPDCMVLLRRRSEGALDVMAANVRDGSQPDGRVSLADYTLGDADLDRVRRAVERGELVHEEADEAGSETGVLVALPLKVGEGTIGCLFLRGNRRSLRLDSSDLIFLTALVDQLAVALDRAELAANLIREKDLESQELRREVLELRQTVLPSRMVFVSEKMHGVLETVRRVAPSAATVLIVGESGTGKEMLARAVHDMSERADGPYVTVDCGAVAHSLLEAELFGHVKGAYTGAESASEGRIVQADGGTLFLDEVGELPLDMQTKLLRFVQEKELTPVGGSAVRKVDVRIVAATNRDLQEEVARGRFRQDLYYRLQVVSVIAPPLRERPDDILPLAKFYLERFSAQHGAQCRQLSPSAARLLSAHDWPGNVRELQHCMLRAVLMSDGPVLDFADIQLLPEGRGAAENGAGYGEAGVPLPARSAGSSTGTRETPACEDGDPWMELERVLAAEVDGEIGGARAYTAPLGQWLQQDLVLAAADASGDVARQAARCLGLPESTYRRQLDRARADVATGRFHRSDEWQRVLPVLRRLVTTTTRRPEDLLTSARCVLLDIVAGRVAADGNLGAALMGVTPPTYKRWIVRHAN